MNCTNCGSPLNAYAPNCARCGAPTGQTAYQQPAYAQYPAYAAAQQEMAPVMTVGNWMGVFILPVLLNIVIPGIGGTILLLVWAFGSNANPNKRNYARASLILSLIAGLIFGIVFIIMFAVIGMSFNDIGYYISLL